MYLYHYHNYFQIFLLIFLVLILYYQDKSITNNKKSTEDCQNKRNEKNNIIENFDEKVTKTTRENCGILCTKTYGCSAFSTDDKNNCYLSKSLILGSPTNSKFMNEYDKNYFRCNKIAKIDDAVIASEMDFKKNATYSCLTSQTSTDQILKIFDTKERDLDNINNLSTVKIDKYTIGEIDWNNTVELVETPIEKSESDNNITIFTKQGDEYLGQYMYHHRCVSDIGQPDCLKDCLNDPKCLGTEWNPVYIKITDGKYEVNSNVCCPKINIKRTIPRRDQFKYGHFYLKEKINKSDENFNKKIFVNLE